MSISTDLELPGHIAVAEPPPRADAMLTEAAILIVKLALRQATFLAVPLMAER